MLVLVTRPTTAELGHAAALLGWLRGRCRRLGLVVAGNGPYTVAAIAEALDVEVLGVIPDDRRGAARLTGAAHRPRRLRHAPLLRAARELAAALEDRANPAPPAGPYEPHGRDGEGRW